MNDETIQLRFDQIDKKLDVLTELVTQTATQDLRIKICEDSIRDIQNQKKNTTDKWLNPLISAIVSGFVAFVFFKVGLK